MPIMGYIYLCILGHIDMRSVHLPVRVPQAGQGVCQDRSGNRSVELLDFDVARHVARRDSQSKT